MALKADDHIKVDSSTSALCGSMNNKIVALINKHISLPRSNFLYVSFLDYTLQAIENLKYNNMLG